MSIFLFIFPFLFFQISQNRVLYSSHLLLFLNEKAFSFPLSFLDKKSKKVLTPARFFFFFFFFFPFSFLNKNSKKFLTPALFFFFFYYFSLLFLFLFFFFSFFSFSFSPSRNYLLRMERWR